MIICSHNRKKKVLWSKIFYLHSRLRSINQVTLHRLLWKYKWRVTLVVIQSCDASLIHCLLDILICILAQFAAPLCWIPHTSNRQSSNCKHLHLSFVKSSRPGLKQKKMSNRSIPSGELLSFSHMNDIFTCTRNILSVRNCSPTQNGFL